MIHEVVDIGRWTTMFPLHGLRELAATQRVAWETGMRQRRSRTDPEPRYFSTMHEPSASEVTSPFDLAVIEQLRAEAAAEVDLGEQMPADVFIWGKGEPARRDVTKIGGLPYLPTRVPWPTTRQGGPMQFVGQFCFADSRDIVVNLPGDILLVFYHPIWEEFVDDQERGMAFVWVNLGESDLIAAVPETELQRPISPYFGQIHRTADYPRLLEEEERNYLGNVPAWVGTGLIRATKIGGLPMWVQGDPGLPGRFLCAQESIQPAFDVPYPWVNVPEPIGPTFAEQYPEDDLMWGDLGTLNLHLDGERVHWEVQFT